MVSNVQANNAMMKKLVIVACAMFAFGFALVPFYNKICEVAGINNVAKADAVTNTQVDSTRLITMEFDTNLRSGLNWSFRPLEKSVRFHPGETSKDSAERGALAATLAELGDAYVDDAFGAVHRAHASVDELPGLLPHAAGDLVLREVEVLTRRTADP